MLTIANLAKITKALKTAAALIEDGFVNKGHREICRIIMDLEDDLETKNADMDEMMMECFPNEHSVSDL